MEQTVDLTIGFDEAYHGSSRSLTLQSSDGSTRNVDVKVPAGVTDGSKLRLRKEGLLLRVRVAHDPRFRIDGRNIVTDVDLHPWEAALGARKPVHTPNGEVMLTIPPGTSSGSKLRLKGRGMPARGKTAEPGDLLVQTRILIPKTLTDEQRAAYEKMRDLAGAT